ncbi:uncharacterized protein G2W53_029085 [Senna tora]|uniref:Uncharacterized protein n=1 Tax=Senna tora TaxID=362788 RepID=A0A834T6J4_9FABA|nr:uncharacterized protein G2W53_029085 [Senna tora]
MGGVSLLDVDIEAVKRRIGWPPETAEIQSPFQEEIGEKLKLVHFSGFQYMFSKIMVLLLAAHGQVLRLT